MKLNGAFEMQKWLKHTDSDNIYLFVDQIEFLKMRQVLCVESSDAVQFVTPQRCETAPFHLWGTRVTFTWE